MAFKAQKYSIYSIFNYDASNTELNSRFLNFFSPLLDLISSSLLGCFKLEILLKKASRYLEISYKRALTYSECCSASFRSHSSGINFLFKRTSRLINDNSATN